MSKRSDQATEDNIARYIEHTLLKPEASQQDVESMCDAARGEGLLAICLSPCWVGYATSLLRDSGVRVVTTCGFPLGTDTTEVKVHQAVTYLEMGADEIDMVMNVGALKSGLYDLVRKDIASVASACHLEGGMLKVILETGLLTEEEKELACKIAVAAGADFIKTSTGFARGGATVEDVALMCRTVDKKAGVKAAGGIRDLATARAMIEAGATRLGTSAGVQIVREARGQLHSGG